MTGLVRSELLKQRSTTTALGLVGAMVAVVLLAILLHVLGLPAANLGSRSTQLSVLGRGEFLGVLFAALLGALTVTSEVRHGTIRPTLLAMPRRARVVAAKLLVSLLYGAAFGLVAAAVAAAAGAAVLATRGIAIQLGTGDWALLIAGSSAAGSLWGAIGLGVGAAVRHQVPALVGICAWLLFVEGLLFGDVAGVANIGRFAPGAAATAITGQDHPAGLLAPAAGLAVLVGYALVAGSVAWLATAKRDV